MPKDLADMAAAFAAKCKAGTAQIHGSGYGGSGFKFDSVEDDVQKASRQVSTLQKIHPLLTASEKSDLHDSCTDWLISSLPLFSCHWGWFEPEERSWAGTAVHHCFHAPWLTSHL